MNKEEILKMEAGEKLNAAVAVVMGDDLEHSWTGGAPKSGIKYCTRCNAPDWAPAAVLRHCSVKLYSEDISVAWLVVEKMKVEDYCQVGGRFCDSLVDMCPDNEELLFWLSPEAICKAVLIARLG